MTTKEDPVLKALLEAPQDDEPLSKDEEQAISEAKEDLKRGRVVSSEAVREDICI